MTDGITGTLERVRRATALELEASSCAIQVGEQHELPGATTNYKPDLRTTGKEPKGGFAICTVV